jgi:HSP90 family molecular chaperone
VLYLTEPVDELLVKSLWDYEGKKLKSAGKGLLKLGEQEEKEKSQAELKKKEVEAADLFATMQKALDEHVKQVRLSNRLVASPACFGRHGDGLRPTAGAVVAEGQGRRTKTAAHSGVESRSRDLPQTAGTVSTKQRRPSDRGWSGLCLRHCNASNQR